MSALRCANCGLVNFATATQCKRCRTPFVQELSTTDGSHVQGIVLEDGYVLPPPPSVGTEGVWREKSTLVMSKDAQLPLRCIKCNQPTPLRLKRTFTWHHPAIYILLIAAWLLYLIVAMVVRKKATVELGLCEEHLQTRRRNVFIAWALVLLGVLCFVLAIAANDGTPALLGLLMLLAALIFGLVVARVAVPVKIDDRFVWLRGINKEYLEMLPQWPGH